MNSYLIFTDSAADMPLHVIEEFDIRFIPMDYMLDGESVTFHTEDPDRDRHCDELYEKLRKGASVHTSQITPWTYIENWKPLLEEGHDILYLAFSSGLSATYENAMNAAGTLQEEFPDRKLVVVDSLSSTGGQGLLTHAAALNRAKGMSISENAAWITEHAKNVGHRFTVGDLDFLHRGGRVSAATAIIGGMLNIKPVMIMDDEGKLQVVSKARGINASLKSLMRSTQRELGVEDVPELVYITHSSVYDKAQDLINMARMVFGEDTPVECICETPIIGVHTGPEFLAIFAWCRHRKEGE